MSEFNVLKKEELTDKGQGIFSSLEKAVGFVPNIYAAMAHSEDGLANYLAFSGAKTSFSNKEKEVIDLAVSQVNGCRYCQAAHTAIGKLNGFTEEQVLELRKGTASWDTKLNALANLTKEVAITKGKANSSLVSAFYSAGYSKQNLVDLTIAIGIITVTNTFHNLTEVEIDFPIAEEIK